MLHMDIKPGNVFLTLRVDEETQRVQDIDVKLADYSLAYINKEEVDMKELGYRGTPGFMSTDIFTVKKYTADSDLFSVIHMALDLFMPIGAPAMLYTHMPKEYLDRVLPLRLDAVTLRERAILQQTESGSPKDKRESMSAAGSHAARAMLLSPDCLRVLCAPCSVS
jgi:Serine/threonine protein kinase